MTVDHITDEPENRWLEILHTEETREKIRAISEVISKWFPDLSKAVVRHRAEGIIASQANPDFLHHKGDKDKKQIKRFEEALAKASRALNRMSPWARQALYESFYAIRKDMAHADALSHLAPLLTHVADARRRTFARMDDSKPEGTTAWAALAAVHEIRRCWESCSGKSATSRPVRDGDVITEFIAEIFQAMGLEADPRSAFSAWIRERDALF